MFSKKSADIAILGVGPTGLIAAHTLADNHADFVLLEREKSANTHSYALDTDGELPMEMRMMIDGDKTHIYWPLNTGQCRFSFQMEPGFAKNDGSSETDASALATVTVAIIEIELVCPLHTQQSLRIQY